MSKMNLIEYTSAVCADNINTASVHEQAELASMKYQWQNYQDRDEEVFNFIREREFLNISLVLTGAQ